MTPSKLSLVIEWTNTQLNGVPRAYLLFDELGRQWRQVAAGDYPATLPDEAGRFLDRLEDRVELLVVSAESVDGDLEEEIRKRLPESFDLRIAVSEGLEYYPLKNFGARLATGQLLLFVDSDVLPDDGWLAHLLGSFAKREVSVVSGQTYVAPTDVFARAFALGWSYDLRYETRELVKVRKYYANNVAFRTEVFRRTGFPPIGRRTRGAASLLRRDLDRLGIPVWQNRHACVDHPPPSSFRHLAIRALAHGRDQYFTGAERRSLRGLSRSLRIAAQRLGHGYNQAFRQGRRVGLRVWELPAVLAILASYYGFFALGGLFTHVSPDAMGRRFRL